MNEAMPKSLVDRVQGVIRLDVPTYEEIEADSSALPQAAMVVAAVAVCQGIGNAGAGFGSLIFAIFATFLAWLVWSTVSFFIGTKFFGGQATWDQVLRVIGFAQAPGLFAIVGLIPFLGWLITPVVTLWTLVAGVIAIRQSLDLTTGKAVATALIGAAIIFFLLLGPIAMLGVGTAVLSGRG